MKNTHTFAVLRISTTAFDEIERLLRGAGYADQFQPDENHAGILMDMHGIALGKAHETEAKP